MFHSSPHVIHRPLGKAVSRPRVRVPYAKRYGTSYADNAVENFMASAALPSLLHQDPRYCQLGRGSFMRRASQALARVVITRTDTGKAQFNQSEVLGAGIAATISTHTRPSQETLCVILRRRSETAFYVDFDSKQVKPWFRVHPSLLYLGGQ